MFGSIESALAVVYPGVFPQLGCLISKGRKAGETRLRNVLQKLFPFKENKVVFNARKAVGLERATINKTVYCELDIWLPKFKLGFEYQVSGLVKCMLTCLQDRHHYATTWFGSCTVGEYLIVCLVMVCFLLNYPNISKCRRPQKCCVHSKRRHVDHYSLLVGW